MVFNVECSFHCAFGMFLLLYFYNRMHEVVSVGFRFISLPVLYLVFSLLGRTFRFYVGLIAFPSKCGGLCGLSTESNP